MTQPGPSSIFAAAPTAAMLVVAVSYAGAAAVETLVSSEEQVAAAVSTATPGDSIVVRDGVYTDWSIRLRASGTAARPIHLTAQTPGGVTLTGNARVQIEGTHLVVSGFLFENAHSARHASVVEFRSAKHCRLTDCSFVHCGDPHSTFTRTINLAYGSSHNRVDHCHMTGTLSMGMGVVVRDSEAGWGNTDNRFDHNHFQDIKRLSSNGQEPIQLGQDQTAFGNVSIRSVVEYNLFDNASGDSEIISNKSADNVIRRNTLRNSRAGICLRGGSNTLVEGNFCWRTHGIRVFGDGHRVINNYLEETEGGILLDAGQYPAGGFVDRRVSGSYQAASGALIAHNTIVNPDGAGIRLGHHRGREHDGVARNELPHGIMVINNLLTGKSGELISDEGSRDVIWKTNLVRPHGAARVGLTHRGILEADSTLVHHDGVRYALCPESPAVDAGTPIQEVATDYHGRARIGLPDVGSEEIDPTGVVILPLRPSDVGPSWRQAGSGRDPASSKLEEEDHESNSR